MNKNFINEFVFNFNFENKFRNLHDEKVSLFLSLVFFFHIFLALFMSWFYKTDYTINLGITILVFLSSELARRFLKKSALLYVVYGMNCMFLSAMVMYAGRGSAEYHFHFFVMMSFLIAFAQTLPLLTAVITITIHHLSTYFLFPGSAFLIDYPFSLYVIHFVAAVFQAIPCLLITYKASRIVDNQGLLLVDLEATANQNNKTSQTLKVSMDKLTSNSTAQVSAISEMSSGVIEIESMMKRNQENVEMTKDRTKKCFEHLNETKAAMESISDMMNKLSDDNLSSMKELNKGARDLEEMVALMESVAEKSQVINDIVFQTKLLSFNASVESARAGEMGKGFAVVAEEVGNLATSSGRAALEINELVESARIRIREIAGSIQSRIENIEEKNQKSIKNSLDATKKGNRLISETSDFVSSIKDSSVEIDSASREQLKGISNINTSLTTINDSMSEISSLNDETKELSQKVSKSSDDLKELLIKINSI